MKMITNKLIILSCRYQIMKNICHVQDSIGWWNRNIQTLFFQHTFVLITRIRSNYCHMNMTCFIFWRSIFPYFWTSRRRVFATLVGSVLDEKSSNQFYIHLCVQILYQFFCCCLNCYSNIYWLTPLKSIYRVKFQIHDGCTSFKILKVSKHSCNWNRLLTTSWIY